MNFNGKNNQIGLSLNGFSNGTNHPTFTIQVWVRAIKKESTSGCLTLQAIDTFLQIPNLKPNTQYYYRVRAVKGSAKKIISTYSNTLGIITSK